MELFILKRDLNTSILKNISNNFQKGVDKTPFLCYNIDTKEREVNKMKLTKSDRFTYHNTKVGEWLDCRFQDEEGEEYFVELRKGESESAELFVARCMTVAEENGFEEPDFTGIFDREIAEVMGLDTY